MTRVFISYSHDDEAHSARVLAFARRLCDAGLTVIINRDLQADGGPSKGWPLWCQNQVRDVERVLVTALPRVCAAAFGYRVDRAMVYAGVIGCDGRRSLQDVGAQAEPGYQGSTTKNGVAVHHMRCENILC